jgi:hypothetical protein
MTKLRQILLATLLVLSATVLAGCQGTATATQAGTPKKKNVGGNIQGDPKGDSFVVSGNRGTYTVDMSKSTFIRDGKPIKKSDLKDGAFVIVSGTEEGNTIKATKVQLMHDKDQLPEKPNAAGTAAGG